MTGAVVVLPEVGLAELGLRGQDVNQPLTGLGITLIPSMLSGIAIGLVLGVVLLAVAVRRGRSQDPPNLEAVRPMLPTTRRGRWGWAGVSVTAGITEEILYRGLLILVVTALAPDLPPAFSSSASRCSSASRTGTRGAPGCCRPGWPARC